MQAHSARIKQALAMLAGAQGCVIGPGPVRTITPGNLKSERNDRTTRLQKETFLGQLIILPVNEQTGFLEFEKPENFSLSASALYTYTRCWPTNYMRLIIV